VAQGDRTGVAGKNQELVRSCGQKTQLNGKQNIKDGFEFTASEEALPYMCAVIRIKGKAGRRLIL
jgi:hypothetical protein